MKKSILGAISGGVVVAVIALALIQSQITIPAQTQPTASSSKIKIIASFYPLYEFSKNVVGDKADVSTFVPIGVEPHDWEPSTGDIVNLKNTDVFVYNGIGMEPFVDKLINSGEYDNVKFIETSDGISLIRSENEGYNPHVWLNPILAKNQVLTIKDAMISTDPQNRQYYEDNANSYIAKLDDLDSEIKAELSSCKKDTFVPFHDAYSYFANRYGLKTFPLSGISPESEATAAEIKEFVDFVKQNQIEIIYSEELIDPKLANALADEAKTQVLVFSPLEGLTNEELQNGMTYLTKMKQNLVNLKVGLECQ
jgi:zinc transport system substrate-binding protein